MELIKIDQELFQLKRANQELKWSLIFLLISLLIVFLYYLLQFLKLI